MQDKMQMHDEVKTELGPITPKLQLFCKGCNLAIVFFGDVPSVVYCPNCGLKLKDGNYEVSCL